MSPLPPGLADVLGHPGDIRLLIVGINPGLRSAQTGHHFARPGNRFWPALFAAGITPRQFRPDEQGLLPALGVGITNLVPRPSATAAEVTRDELRVGARRLTDIAVGYRPRVVAVLGVTAYRVAFGRPRATAGVQPQQIAESALWVLPNPSGLNAHAKPADHAAALRAVANAAGFFADQAIRPAAGAES